MQVIGNETWPRIWLWCKWFLGGKETHWIVQGDVYKVLWGVT